MMRSGIFNRFVTGMIGFLAVTAFTISNNNTRAQYFSASQIYAYARANDVNALYRLRNYLEMQDGYGNTALCMAVMDDNLQAYNLLKQYGANTQPQCLSAALAGSGGAAPSMVSSGSFLGMGTTGWIVTGAIVAGGVGIAAAAGGGGGHGGSSDPKCVHGTMSEDVCVCNEGWTGSNCNTAKSCGSDYKEVCAEDEYTNGSVCKSGDKNLKKCIAHTPMPNCQTYSATSDTCAVCKEGWEGSQCETAKTCGSDFKSYCTVNEYTDGSTCKSGDSLLKKCIAHSSMPNCQTFSTTSDTCAVCKDGWEGSKCETAKTCGTGYKASCTTDEYTDGSTCKSGDSILKRCIAHTPMPNCQAYSTTSDTCAVCKEGWEGSKCETARACGTDYKASCADDEYTDGSTCKSGDSVLKKCIAHTPMPNCQTYSDNEDVCVMCKAGWEGTQCETAKTCGTEYKASCADDEYTDGNTCQSGDDVLKKCIEHTPMPNCQTYSTTSDTCAVCKAGWSGDTCETPAACGTEYKASCADDEYTDGSTCQSGGDVLKKCLPHTPMPNCQTYSTTSDTCAVCKAGWEGSQCETAKACGTEYKASCADDEYTDGNTCQSGDNVLKKCIEHTPMPNCQTYSTTSDTCAVCKAGWEGSQCETAKTCGTEYKVSCADDEYTDGSTCQSGDDVLKKCIAHTPLPYCQIYSPIADVCLVCQEGLVGDACDIINTCGSDYRVNCLDDEYTDGSTCTAGGIELKKCVAHTPLPNCQTYSPTADVCAVCKEGWSGDTCETPATCGTEYKASCADDEYTDGSTCKSGEDVLKKCLPHTPMPNCQTYSPTADTCMVCKEGWSGSTCETPATCGTEYKASCADDEYTDGSTCQSGGDVLKKCLPHTPLPNCQTYSPIANICAVCKEGWSGDTCETPATCGTEYKASCADDEYTDGNTCKSGEDVLKKCLPHTPLPNCQTYSPTADVCAVCKEGWSGDTCETSAACGEGYKLTCADDEYTDGNTCQSGEDVLKKCLPHTPMPNCQTYSTTSDTCAVCKEGWNGTTCETPATCEAEYKASCAADEYTDGHTCQSGDDVLKKCIAHTPMPNCQVYSDVADVCATCKAGWGGDKCEISVACGDEYKLTCAADEYTDGNTCQSGSDILKKCIAHTPMPNCQIYSDVADVCMTCKEGWSGDTCEISTTCSDDFKVSCAEDEYTDGSTCESGGEILKKCLPHTPLPNCQTYSDNSDTCAICKEGWSGDTCETPVACGGEYKETCADDEYTDGSTCESGESVLKKCIPHTPMPNCQTYSPTADVCAVCKEGWMGAICSIEYDCGFGYKDVCGETEYTDGQTCYSGDKELKKCIEHTPIINCQTYSPTADVCEVCSDGWTGETCMEAATCGDEFKNSCAFEEYTDGTTCQSGYDVLKKCLPHTPIPNCQTYSDTSDTCAVCKEGWSGSQCDIAGTCESDFKESCQADEYTNGETCVAGGVELIKCIAHTPMPNCETLNSYADNCLVCKYGWNGDKCETPATCGDEYKLECDADEYTDSSTCQSGDDLLKKCIPHTPMPNCVIQSAYADYCLECKEGWVGTTCADEYDCGEGFKAACSADEYTDGTTCKSGNTDMKKCIAHSDIAHCETLSSTADVCEVCEDGWVGDLCDAPDDDHIIGEDGNLYPKLQCNHGHQVNAACVCDYGYVGDFCNERGILQNSTEVSISDFQGVAYGLPAGDYYAVENEQDGTVTITNTTGEAIGIEGTTDLTADSHTKNKGSITISDTSLNAYGIRSYGGDIVNTSTGSISISGTQSDAYGIFNAFEEGGSTEDVDISNQGAISVAETQGNAYGIMANEYSTVTNTETGVITIEDTTGKVSGIAASKTVTNEGEITISGISDETYGVVISGDGDIINGENAEINISNGTGRVYAAFTLGDITNEGNITVSNVENLVHAVKGNAVENKAGAEINIINSGSLAMTEAVAGIDSSGVTVNSGTINISGSKYDAMGITSSNSGSVTNTSTGVIRVTSSHGGQGMYALGSVTIKNEGEITIENSGVTYGLVGQYSLINDTGATINLDGGSERVRGFFMFSSGTAVNRGVVNISNSSGDVIGMYSMGAATLTNAAGAEINISNTTGMAYGIYAANGSHVNNAGSINITNSPSAYGIYAEGSGVVITNTGTISINGDSCSGNACKDDSKFIKLNGATFNQSGVLQSNIIKLDDYDGTVVASQSSKFIADDISGNLVMNSDVVKGGFENTYTVNDMIKAENTSDLNLVSGSAMFDATLENNSDAVLSMKAFEDVVKDKSLAEFLKQNYAGENNEALYNELKKQKTVTALNDALKDLTGSDVFNRFAFEDMTMMRELNMDMNNTLFNNEDKHLETSGSVTPLNFDGNSGSNARYALYNNISGRKSFGFGFAFSDIHSNNGKDNKDTRRDQTFMVSAPFGYRTHGFKFITSPRFGYAYGTYSRDGYEGRNYDGKVEKRIFGLMNEVRYPISLGKWSIAPSAEFNILGYNVRGHEDAQRYSLRIKSQNNYSVESGLGIYANREMNPTKNSLLKFNIGMAVYHEFADPYSLRLGMSEMDGTYKVRDERRGDNRAVVRSGFDYSLGKDWSIIGSVATFIDGTIHNNSNIDFKYNF